MNVNFPRTSDGPYKGAMLAGISKRVVADAVETQTRGTRTMYWIQRRASALDERSQLEPSTDLYAMDPSSVSLHPPGTGLGGTD